MVQSEPNFLFCFDVILSRPREVALSIASEKWALNADRKDSLPRISRRRISGLSYLKVPRLQPVSEISTTMLRDKSVAEVNAFTSQRLELALSGRIWRSLIASHNMLKVRRFFTCGSMVKCIRMLKSLVNTRGVCLLRKK